MNPVKPLHDNCDALSEKIVQTKYFFKIVNTFFTFIFNEYNIEDYLEAFILALFMIEIDSFLLIANKEKH